MNFDDTPQEAAFRAEAKAWITANAPKQYEEELRKSSLGRTQLKGCCQFARGKNSVRLAWNGINNLRVGRAIKVTRDDSGH